MDVNAIRSQVLHNCDISDAHHAGTYSVCGLAMRLRDLYKWSSGLLPWQEGESATVLDWIGQKETLWESLEGSGFSDITLAGRTFDPFETERINQVLKEHGLYYGAGLAFSLKPTFFLASIDRTGSLSGFPVIELGREHARDLLTLPAFTQDGTILLRKEAGRTFLWDKIAYMETSGRKALDFALASAGLPDSRLGTVRHHFDSLVDLCRAIFLHHEIGEMECRALDHALFSAMVADFPHTLAELLIRTLKDILADTGPSGTLAHLTSTRNQAGLGLFIAFSRGLHRLLIPAVTASFDAFMRRQDWSRIQDAVVSDHRHAEAYAGELAALYQSNKDKDKERCRLAIEETLSSRGLV